MNSVSQLSLSEFPDEVNLNIISYLEKREIQAVACNSQAFNNLANDFQIWKPRTENRFGNLLAQGAKEPNKSWKKVYEELDSSAGMRTENLSKVLQTHIHKVETDDLHYRTSRAAAALFGFAPPKMGTHYIPTGQTGLWGNRKITVYKTTQQ